MAPENSRDAELLAEFAAARDPEDPAVLKARIDKLESRLNEIDFQINGEG